MKTTILMWNPAISSFQMEDFRKCIKVLKNNVDWWNNEDEDEPKETVHLNWSVWDHEEVGYPDRFYMVRVGEGKTGIVMAGEFDSYPYEGEDWSGKGRKTYYADLNIDVMVDTEKMPYISTETLMEALPSFDWTGGHSGRVLDQDSALKLEAMWAEYLYANLDEFDFERGANATSPDYIPMQLEKYLLKTRDGSCEVCGYNFKKMWGEDCEAENTFIGYVPRNAEVRGKDGDTVWKHLHCICNNCMHLPYKMLAEKLGEKDYFNVEKSSDK